MRILRTLLFALLATVLAAAQGTQTWKETSFDEFEKGTARGVAIRSDGTLELAPAFKSILTTPSTYIWDMTSDLQGNVYVAAGGPARVYRITPAGQATIIFQPQELQVQAIVVDASGLLYAATSPDGKVYRIEPKNQPKPTEKEKPPKSAPTPSQNQESEAVKAPVDVSFTSSVYFDPKTKYIWALQLDAQGNLYVATGDRGEIFRINRNGQGALFFKSDEAHIRSLAMDKAGNLIAGSDGSGLVYRISPAGEGFVLYSAPKKEITALAVDPNGNIYAAGVGEKRQPSSQGPVIPQASAAGGTGLGGNPNVIMSTTAAAPPISIQSFSGATTGGGSDVYLIAPDGEPRRIWNGKDDIVYAMALDRSGQLLVGTGNRGRIYAVKPNGDFTDLLKASANQITAFAPAPGGGLYGSTSNLGKVFLLGGSLESEGTYDSDVFDARIFSRWGRSEVRGRGLFDLYARSGNVDNPDRNWSAWSKVDLAGGGTVSVPAARFVQWRAVLHTGNTPPNLESVALNFLTKNVPPVVDDVWVQPGARFNPPPKIGDQNQPVQVGAIPAFVQPRFDVPVPAVRDHDSVAVRWTAHDDNDDNLVYSLYYRGDGENNWKLLKDHIADKFYSWDAGLLPDGGYVVRVVASDLPSHSPNEAMSGTRESARFEVDRTPPALAEVTARLEGDGVRLTFRAVDGYSPIRRAEFSLDAGDWQVVEPVGQISDAKQESYSVVIPMTRAEQQPAGAGGSDHGGNTSEHTIVVRAYDRFDNMGTGKVVFVVR